MNDNKKRYVLFSKDDGRSDAEKPCAFFASPAGCKNGSNCKFLHSVKQNINFHQSLNTSNNNVNNNLSSSYNVIDRSNDNTTIAIDNSNNTNIKIKSKDKKIKNTDNNQYNSKATTVHSSSSNNNNNYNNNHVQQLNSSQLHGSSQLQQSHTTVAAVSSNSNDLIIQQLRDQLAQQQQLLNTHVLTNTNANNQAFNYSQAVGSTYNNNQITTHTSGSGADTNHINTTTQQSSSSSSSNTKKKQEKKRKSSDGNEINDNSSPINTSNKKKSSYDTSSSSLSVSTNNQMDLPYHSNPYSSIIASTQVIAGNRMSTLTQHHHNQQQPQPPSLASITNYETNDDYDEDEDEDNNQFLLSVVNHVLDSSAQKAPLLSTQFQQQQHQPNQHHQHQQQSLQLQQKQQMQHQPQQQYLMSHLPPPISNQHQIIAPPIIEMKQQQPLIQTNNTYTTVPITTTTAVSSSSSSSSIIATNPFINSQDALKALQSSGSTHALYNVSKKNIFATPKASTSNTSTNNTSIINDVKIPRNIFNPALVNFHELPWMKLVEQTKLNFRYPNNYTYVEDSSWVKAKIYGPWCITNNNIKNIISLDCEMCETTDPVTNNKYDNTLIRISVFDIDHKVLIDSLVQPGLPITETRTNIHGITEKQLAVAPWTLRQAQAALLNICSDQTIIIGHSIHKDLKSLKFNHKNVIDTAYLYTVDNEPGAAPSLRDISEQILGIKLPETHNSIQDAQAALYAAATLLAYGPQPSISRKSSSLSLTKEFSLLIHRIPDYCNEEQLHHMIIDYTYIVPIKVNTIIRGDSGSDDKNNNDYQKKGDIPSGKTIITFSTQQHRDLAFDSIVGPNRPDKQNRPQKRIYFKGGGYICIRR